jgi:hypothetical protein
MCICRVPRIEAASSVLFMLLDHRTSDDYRLGRLLVMDIEENDDLHYHIPRVVKIVILAQAAVILTFTIGMYQEYVSNFYLQQYIVSLFRSNIVADALLSMVTVSVFAIGTFTLLGSMSTTKKINDWKALSEKTEEAMDIPVMPVLETAEPAPSTSKAGRRPRQRRPKLNNDDLFRSITRYAEDRRQYSDIND